MLSRTEPKNSVGSWLTIATRLCSSLGLRLETLGVHRLDAGRGDGKEERGERREERERKGDRGKGEERAGERREREGRDGRKYTPIYPHIIHIPPYTPIIYPHIPSYASIHLHISTYTLIHFKVSNIRNMRADMKPKNDHISIPTAFPKV